MEGRILVEAGWKGIERVERVFGDDVGVVGVVDVHVYCGKTWIVVWGVESRVLFKCIGCIIFTEILYYISYINYILY